MNEAEPIVTYHGNQSLFLKLSPAISHGLPKEACQWRRSYGRAPRSVYLSASFVPYDADILLPDEEEKTLVSRPYFHIYITDCDMDAYKQSVKDDIAEWHAALKARNIPDWLIVVVTGEDSKVKTKLLQRASVADKVKSDFCGKYTERCIVLSEPNKLDSKSSESWSQFFQRLRSLLLEAFNRHLNKYEEGMRTRREKRNETGWNYFSYFIVQEELAFMFEMLGLKEDALIQYDELDAMFDQFVENYASGDTVSWLTPLMDPCTSWAGLALSKPLDHDLRQQVKQNDISLLAFRNYLFSRQAALLFQMGRAWEVAMRGMDYLYNSVVEVKALEIEAPQGAVSCWVFLSCLEVLRACKLHNPAQLDKKCALYTASLWDYARIKLRELGQLCSLMPGMVPTSEQLSLVVDLVSGMGIDDRSLYPTDDSSTSHQSPVDKLRESLSSPESFKRHYLDMCEQAMGTFKYIGRFRSARLIGMELADFYMKINEPSKGENFLLDSIRMYQQEGWHQLADGAMIELARCQKVLGEPHSYVKTSCHIACSQYIPTVDRVHYLHEMKASVDQLQDETAIEMRASQSIFVEHLQLDSASLSLNDDLTLTVTLTSNFPEVMTFDTVQISIVKVGESGPNPSNQMAPAQHKAVTQTKAFSHRRQPSGTHITLDKMSNFQPVTKTLPNALVFHTFTERTKGRLVSCGTTCDRAHELLARSDSSNSNSGGATLIKADYSDCFSLKGVTLNPGHNEFELTTKATQHGVYCLGQMCLTFRSLELLKPLTSDTLHFTVQSICPQFTLRPKHSADFLLGVEQEAVLCFNSGSFNLKEPSVLSVTTSPLFSITPDNSCDQDDDQGNLTESEEKSECDTSETDHGEKQLTLAPMHAGDCQELPVTVFMPMKRDEDDWLESKVSISVDGWQDALHADIKFVHPFHTSHKLYTAGTQKYFQVIVSGVTTNASFTLIEPQLESPACNDVDFSLLNPPHQKLVVNRHQSVSLLWLLEPNLALLPSLDLDFSCTYDCHLAKGQGQSRTFSYSCSIYDFQTQYILSYSVTSIEEDKACAVGETAILDIKVKQISDLDLTDGVKLAYTVKANGTVWAIGEKSSGLFSLKDGKHSIALDVVPMQPGLLFYPLVTLYRCLDQTEDGEVSDVESVESGDEDSSPLHSKTSTKKRISQLPHKLLEFSHGQVYNESCSRQIKVRQSTPSTDAELSGIQS